VKDVDQQAIIDKYVEYLRAKSNISKKYEYVVRKILGSINILTATTKSILDFLDSFIKPESIDPLHKSIATRNYYFEILRRFFRWYKKSHLIKNIKRIRRKEISIYKPDDMWTEEEDLLFLKYCRSTRDKCFHMVTRDISGRPGEALAIKVKDIKFKIGDNDRPYAEVVVNGKTGRRPLVLYNSLPCLKDQMDELGSNTEQYLINSAKKGRLGVKSMYGTYMRYKKVVFPALLESNEVEEQDKEPIRKLLTKPWNPYVRRHTGLTEKSKKLPEKVFKQHAGWTPRSQMSEIYVNYFGNESVESMLEIYGIKTKNNQKNTLSPKFCSNCNEPNKPDAKFCRKCRMVMSYEAWEEARQGVDMDMVDKLSKRLEALEATIH
jgi:integrase/recombinase XerD